MNEFMKDLSRLWTMFTRTLSHRPVHEPEKRTPHKKNNKKNKFNEFS